ncbi:hypothetical protein BGW38_009287, partial [Lunasporangiospora selenospora]
DSKRDTKPKRLPRNGHPYPFPLSTSSASSSASAKAATKALPADRDQLRPSFAPHQVIIAGGNIQGLVLGLILLRLRVDYIILERAFTEGVNRNVIVLGSFVLNILEMLGLLDQVKGEALSSPPWTGSTSSAPTAPTITSTEMRQMTIWSEAGTVQAEADFANARERFAHNGIAISFRRLQQILRDHHPPGRCLDHKSVVRYEQSEDEVVVHCTDATVYMGEVLVGCD